MPTIAPLADRIAAEVGIRTAQATAAITLLDGGATVPFIARYRKEATHGLDDTQLRALETQLSYLRELDQRRATILAAIDGQGRLTPEIEAALWEATTKSRLEDVYLPFKPQRRTKAQIAREAGLEPLARGLLADPRRDPFEEAAHFLAPDHGITDAQQAVDGARAIVMEIFGEDANLIGDLREYFWKHGELHADVVDGHQDSGQKFSDYFAHRESLVKAPSHRVLAIFRAEAEGVLTVTLEPSPLGDSRSTELSPYEQRIARAFSITDAGRPADTWLVRCVRLAWRARISTRLAADLRLRLRERAEAEAIRVFAANLNDLLLAAPAGARVTLGLDPGLRTGVKVAVVDATGKVMATTVIYPHQSARRWDDALATLSTLVKQHQVALVAVGNGTASRETDQLAKQLAAKHPGLTTVMVSEAGASVYSASEYASQELPELDVSLRGAVSIARRLQDPLAELVKIDPQSIGVGQYQHDVNPAELRRSLHTVVEDAVNKVGVDVNTASVPLLARVSGIGPGLAAAIVAHRDTHGAFVSRAALTKVPRLGPKAFEQCAGFLRIRDGQEPLDASAVHPESYPLARAMAAQAGVPIAELIGQTAVLQQLPASEFVTPTIGLPTIVDVLAELDKPGRDPRPEFATAQFTQDVTTINDVSPGMILEGVVTNCAAFGAFVDIGVHQDGLVHISALANRFIANPRDVVKPGDVVRVKVLSVDHNRNRIALTLRLDDPLPDETPAVAVAAPGPARRSPSRPPRTASPEAHGAMAEALRRAGLAR